MTRYNHENRYKHAHGGIRRLLFGILTGIFALLLIWGIGFAVFIYHALSLQPQAPSRITDAIIVPTGSKNRIEKGLELFAAGRASHLFITGVHPGVSTRSVKAKWQGEPALPPCCVSLDHLADSTRGNAEQARKWMIDNEYTSARLITSSYHMPRAFLEMRHALPGVDLLIHPIDDFYFSLSSRFYFRLAVLEYHKFIYRYAVLYFTPQTPLPLPDNKPRKGFEP